MGIRVSGPIMNLKPSVTLGIDEKVRSLRKEGHTVYHLGFGSSPFPAPETVQQALRDNADKNKYYSSIGVPELRTAIAEFYENKYALPTTPEQIMIAPGSKSLFFLLSNIIEGPLLLPQPSWVSHEPQARIIGKTVYRLKTNFDDDLLVTSETLEKNLKQLGLDNKKQKLMLINYPNNPTGASYEKNVLEELAETCKKYNIFVISDEIYGLLTFEGTHYSFSNFLPEKTFMTTSLSKDRSLGGYRLGVIRVPNNEKEILGRFKALASEIWSCVPGPIQFAAIAAYQSNTDINQHIEISTKIYKTVVQYAYQKLKNETNLKIPHPKGAYYIYPDFSQYEKTLLEIGIKNSEQLSHYLLDKYHVATLPSTPFGMSKKQFFLRLALVDFDGNKAMNEWKSFTVKKLDYYAPRVVEGINKIIEFLSDL